MSVPPDRLVPGASPESSLVSSPDAVSRPPRTDRVVFGVAAGLVLAIVLWGLLDTGSFDRITADVLDWIVVELGWLYVLAASAFVFFVLWLALSKYGRIPLGQDGEKPEFRTVSWIAMMFSAGMGIGLMFFGVGEPLSHYVDEPPGTVGGTGVAMATAMFHWGLHPWAIYAVVGLAIAYGTFRRGRRQLISAAFIPLLGRRAEGPIGKFIDILALFATLFGTAASLGLGALQIGSGFEINGWLETAGVALLVGIVAILTLAFIGSAVSGVAKGIQWLSNINMVLAVILALFVFVFGPTVFILNLIPTTLGAYASDFAQMSARTAASNGPAGEWLSSWTIFYWAWWVSWAPFVGMFLARISRGRTIRQFVVGVMLVPSLVSLLWFAIFGGAAIRQQEDGFDLAGAENVEGQLFGMLGNLPLVGVSTVVVMLLVSIFFVSGADAASMVMGSLTQRGTLRPSPWIVVFWGALTGGVAALLLWTGGSDALNALQTMTIIAAVPFVVVMIGLCVCLYRDLSTDPLITGTRRPRRTLYQVK
ncbi:BCCT family transporter [Rhodococcus coprophilus]|uniref:Glycine betaine transporter n=2 Tax=Nocardiaceae TaxID=85025 RepID=A0A2X4TSX7_9NOCA|nr:BCCT family transporter [Rhodococcus coprophilus]MBM7457884.1 choline/carnitine/betaine transport [Rhodococcus coprophilus]SQI30506.1 glycine betaine transporter [Rhodococcus coprophilus]